jgi:hypothetical protein
MKVPRRPADDHVSAGIFLFPDSPLCYNAGMAKEQAQQEIVIYRDKRGDVTLRADADKETIWATQAQITEVFGIDRTVVTKHIKKILKDKELQKESVCANFAHTAEDGKIYQVQFYNLDVVLAVGYRTNSARAIAFRQWATKTLRDYIIKGYALNAKRLQKARQTSVKELEKTLRFIQGAIRRQFQGAGELFSYSVISC